MKFSIKQVEQLIDVLFIVIIVEIETVLQFQKKISYKNICFL